MDRRRDGASVREYAAYDHPETTTRITEIVLGTVRDRRWLLLPGIVLPFLLQHALQGWCPPIEIIRRLGVRTRREIDRERVALKALRGDFGLVSGGSTPQERAKLALAAAEE